jgi:transcriptional regulator with XRE-family HTH domain
LLRFARERNGLSRRAVAARAGISESLLYGMESGKRAMQRETIVAVGRAMTLDVASVNAVLEASGFAPEPSDQSAYMLGYQLSPGSRYAGNLERRTSSTPADVTRELEGYAWPALVVNERCELIALNASAAGVFGFDLLALPPGPARNLFSLVSDAAFRTRAANWETIVANVLPGDLEAYMAPPGGHSPRGKDAAYFEAVVQFVREREAAAGRGDAVVHRLFAAWRAKSNRRPTARTAFVLEWGSRQPPLAFNTVITPWNSMIDPYWAIELHPGDARTWRALSS